MCLLIYENWLIRKVTMLRYCGLSEKALVYLGALLAKQLSGGDCLLLSGELGAGKTTLTRAMLGGLHYSGRVKSPSYTLVESYALSDGLQLFHFDFYRISSPAELLAIGFDDYLTDQAILVIEWPEKAWELLPKATILCDIAIQDAQRDVTLRSELLRGQHIIATLPRSL